MSEEKKLTVHLQLSVFRKDDAYQIVNLETFEGTEQPFIFAYGFDSKGNPVLKANEPRTYSFSGAVCGHVNLNGPFHVGISINGKKIIGFDAVQVMVSKYGLHIDKQAIIDSIKILIDNGATAIYFVKESSTYGMFKAYGFTDKWLILGKEPEMNLDRFNTLLKSIKSQWRVMTPKTRILLRKLEYKRLEAGNDE